MGNFEKLSVLVIVVIIVMILVVALYSWSGNPDESKDTPTAVKTEAKAEQTVKIPPIPVQVPAPSDKGLPVVQSPTAFPPAPVVVPAPVVEAPKAEPKVHEVVSGDTLGRIAKKYGTTVVAIEQANAGVEPERLKVGQKLTIPEKAAVAKADAKADAPKAGKDDAGGTKADVETPSAKPGTVYTFRKGDTLPSLSKRAYGTADRWHEIWIANYSAIDNPDLVPPGTRVKLPAK